MYKYGAVKSPKKKQAAPKGAACKIFVEKRLIQWKNQPFCSIINLPRTMKTTAMNYTPIQLKLPAD